jgi:hypothetical protein
MQKRRMARVLRGLAQKAAASMQQISKTVARRIAQSQNDALMKHALLAVLTKWALQTRLRESGVRKTTTDAEISKVAAEMRRRYVKRGDDVGCNGAKASI